MTWPTIFGNLLGGNQPLSLIDGMFQQTAQMLEIPCSASGATAISLTPLVNCPVLTGYTEFCAARFRATANSGAGVTAQINGLGFLNVYKADGVTQCGLNDLVINFEYVVRFSQALGGGGGGWFLEAPAFGTPGGGGGGGGFSLASTPGGRLTLLSGVPVVSNNVVSGPSSQTIYYAPYVHPFVSIFNGTSVQTYQYTSGLSDTVGLSLPMGGSSSWPASIPFDVFVTLVGGLPVLCSVQWAGVNTRATGLGIFGGFLTNAAATTARTSASTTITLQANQGTFLGSFNTVAAGESVWRFGGAAVGGSAAQFGVCNYYNKVLFNTLVIDNGGFYTYATATVRPARGSLNNSIVYMQSDSERAANFSYNSGQQVVVANGVVTVGIGINTGVAFTALSSLSTPIGNFTVGTNVPYLLASTGLTTVVAVEEGDGANPNRFCTTASNTLFGNVWL
jgi:hypothetical protein